MKFGFVVIGLFVNFGVFSGNAWDIAVAVKDQIIFLDVAGKVVGNLTEGLKEVRALAYIEELSQMYFVDYGSPNGSIFRVTIPKNFTATNEVAEVEVVVPRQELDVKGLAYDDMTGVLYWSVVGKDGGAIMFTKIDPTGGPQQGQQLLALPGQKPISLAIDICQRFLYWSNTEHKNASVERLRLDNSFQRETVVSSNLASPNSVVVDQLASRLFWVDETPGTQFCIESTDLDGKERSLLYSGSNHQPFALTVVEDSVFWTDHIKNSVWSMELKSKNHFYESSNPREIASYPHSPRALVSSHSGRWHSESCNKVVTPVMKIIPATVTRLTATPPTTTMTPVLNITPPVCHNNGVWRQDGNYCECPNGYIGTYCEIIPLPVRKPIPLVPPIAVAPKSEVSRPPCLHNGLWKADENYCDCPTGYSGIYCEVDDCQDYCLNGGQCLQKVQGPQCACARGFTGERCQESVCHNYCVHGNCSVDVTGMPQCHCLEGFTNARCDVNYSQQQGLQHNLEEVCQAFCHLWDQSEKNNIQPFDVCSCTQVTKNPSPLMSEWNESYIMMGLLTLCGVLSLVVAVLTWKIVVLRKRPRVKKRIIVNKNVTPLTCRPNPGDQCEITIENCCNMNICETPCFEPNFRQPELMKSQNKGAKEEQKTLLGNMELPPDDLY